MVICIYLRVISQEATETLIHKNEFENPTIEIIATPKGEWVDTENDV